MKRFFRHNGLSLALGASFLFFWGAQAIAGWKVFNEQQSLHSSPALEFSKYLLSGHFWQATGENWESEFLQMGIYVIFTCFLFQKGSAESKDPDGANEADKPPKRNHSFFYRNSLSIVLMALFLSSFLLHAVGGWNASNSDRAEHGQSAESFGEFLSGSEFWFQSFQNWQSEFLAVFSIVVLSIFLRQQGSPESKHVDAANSETGA